MSLYLEHFGLREPPFRITPHTDFFFSGANRGPTLDALIYAITQDEGIVAVSGEVGSGKTMLCRMLLECLPKEVETLYLANPSLSRQEILGAIADELGIPIQAQSTHSLIRAIHNSLIDRYAAGKRVVLLIDEAHAMPAESLEEIRLLSNLESKATKLLQIALFGQPELDARLAAPDMRQLRERITQHFDLTPLKPGDVANYIEFRLRKAGYHGPFPFSKRAIEMITRFSEGLSRRINILADKALLAAYSSGDHRIDQKEISLAAKDARFRPLKPTRQQSRTLLPWTAGIALLTGLSSMFLLPSQKQEAPVPPTPPLPLAQTVALQPSLPKHSAPPTNIKYGPLTRQHLAQYESWIAEVPRHHYFLQLFATDAQNTGEIEGFLGRIGKLIDPAELRAYRSTLSGHDRVGIIYGDFPTREEAAEAMHNLPEAIRAAQPFPRPVTKLR
ncbi:MAG: AAA family ATPase [Rhodocyclales bacterium GT-UBC]|nr:MAG: AAA family ATPase [Rhodocyclales bacterium GT-UBC]